MQSLKMRLSDAEWTLDLRARGLRDAGGADEIHLSAFFRKLNDLYRGLVAVVLIMSQNCSLCCKSLWLLFKETRGKGL